MITISVYMVYDQNSRLDFSDVQMFQFSIFMYQFNVKYIYIECIASVHMNCYIESREWPRWLNVNGLYLLRYPITLSIISHSSLDVLSIPLFLQETVIVCTIIQCVFPLINEYFLPEWTTWSVFPLSLNCIKIHMY